MSAFALPDETAETIKVKLIHWRAERLKLETTVSEANWALKQATRELANVEWEITILEKALGERE